MTAAIHADLTFSARYYVHLVSMPPRVIFHHPADEIEDPAPYSPLPSLDSKPDANTIDHHSLNRAPTYRSQRSTLMLPLDSPPYPESLIAVEVGPRSAPVRMSAAQRLYASGNETEYPMLPAPSSHASPAPTSAPPQTSLRGSSSYRNLPYQGGNSLHSQRSIGGLFDASFPPSHPPLPGSSRQPLSPPADPSLHPTAGSFYRSLGSSSLPSSPSSFPPKAAPQSAAGPSGGLHYVATTAKPPVVPDTGPSVDFDIPKPSMLVAPSQSSGWHLPEPSSTGTLSGGSPAALASPSMTQSSSESPRQTGSPFSGGSGSGPVMLSYSGSTANLSGLPPTSKLRKTESRASGFLTVGKEMKLEDISATGQHGVQGPGKRSGSGFTRFLRTMMCMEVPEEEPRQPSQTRPTRKLSKTPSATPSTPRPPMVVASRTSSIPLETQGASNPISYPRTPEIQ